MGDLIAVIFIIFGTILGLIVLWKVFDMVKGTIKGKRNKEYEQSFDRMAHAFIQHKKDIERRMENVEAIVAQENKTSRPTLNESQEAGIEIDEPVSRNENKNKGSNLSNNLRTE